MTFQKGQSGNLLGQLREKPYREALRLEIVAAGPDHKALRRIARKHLALAAEGKMDAINALADRLDGRPAQEATLTIDDKRELPQFSDADLLTLLAERRKEEPQQLLIDGTVN